MKPAKLTPYERYITSLSFKWLPKNKINIKKIFNMIGAAAAIANLLWEFKIAEKKEATLMNNRNGKVNLVR